MFSCRVSAMCDEKSSTFHSFPSDRHNSFPNHEIIYRFDFMKFRTSKLTRIACVACARFSRSARGSNQFELPQYLLVCLLKNFFGSLKRKIFRQLPLSMIRQLYKYYPNNKKTIKVSFKRRETLHLCLTDRSADIHCCV